MMTKGIIINKYKSVDYLLNNVFIPNTDIISVGAKKYIVTITFINHIQEEM